jgi:hypothetical protein
MVSGLGRSLDQNHPFRSGRLRVPTLHAPGIAKESELNPTAFKIELNLYATLQTCALDDAAGYPVEAGTFISEIVEALKIARDQVKLIILTA